MKSDGSANRISVIGAGALGTLFAGLIKHHQPSTEVVLLARGPHLDAMRERGVAELHGSWGVRHVEVLATDDPEAVRSSDLVLFTVKSQDTRDAAARFASYCGNATIVSLQNGINQRDLADFFPQDRLLAGMTTTNMALSKPGVVEFRRNGVSVIGPATRYVTSDTLQQARQTLSHSGLRFEVDQSIRGIQYNKLLMNTMGYASVLSASDFTRDCILHPQWRRHLAVPLLEEGMRVLRVAGIDLKKTPAGADTFRIRKLMRFLNIPAVNPIVRPVVQALNPPRVVFSVYQDLQRQRRTEINFVNGEIVRLANEHGCEAPYNAEVVRAIHELEASPRPVFFSHREVIDRFNRVQHAAPHSVVC